MADKTVIQVEHLSKSYGSVTAVQDASFTVHEGEIFGMVGPNGAGKTTTVECVEGLRQRDSGQVRVLGLDPQADGYKLRPRIGVQLQQSALQDRLKVWEALDLFAALYPRSVPWEPLLEQLGLAEKRNAAFAQLSGGQKQRLFIALALVNDPELVFLDELTTGLDPQARHATWDLVRGIRERGKTIFLITHYMEEAEQLCDRVAIMDHGQMIALDTPEKLIESLSADNRILLGVDGAFDGQRLSAIPGVVRVEQNGDRLVIYGHGDMLVVDIVNALAAAGVRCRDLRTEQPNLEDVFLALTGRKIRE